MRLTDETWAAMVRAAIAGVLTTARFQDWVEDRKAPFREGGKWTEEVNLGLGSPALVISGLLPFPIDGDLGFGKPRLVMPWLRHGLDGGAQPERRRVVPMEVVESDPLLNLKPAGNLGLAAPPCSRL
ncbi:hypothetical protein HU200_035767 [Digitaria exilis]|uniref:Uncharacterized protein n=1 Tax=Digitaria exilis TaxID=1010633 RepID=A0A835BHP4_9POAL|nr:hypothetical protein HU200_035767 [Digitaria exilis]